MIRLLCDFVVDITNELRIERPYLKQYWAGEIILFRKVKFKNIKREDEACNLSGVIDLLIVKMGEMQTLKIIVTKD